MSGQQFMQSIGESFIVDVRENVVHSSVLKQIVLYPCVHAIHTFGK